MKLKITKKECLIACDGLNAETFVKGNVLEVSAALGASLVRDKWGVEIEPSPTFEEFVSAGYSPAGYPPPGYDEVPSAGLTAYRAEQAEAAADAARIAAQAADADRIAAEDAARVAANGPDANKATAPGETK